MISIIRLKNVCNKLRKFETIYEVNNKILLIIFRPYKLSIASRETLQLATLNAVRLRQ